MDERARQSLDAIDRLLDRTTPWLSEIGSWAFGGLVAVNLVVISSLLTVGPIDAAVRISVAVLARTLPLNVAGIVVSGGAPQAAGGYRASVLAGDRGDQRRPDTRRFGRRAVAHGVVDRQRPSRDGGTQRGPGARGVRSRAAAGVRMGESAEDATTSVKTNALRERVAPGTAEAWRPGPGAANRRRSRPDTASSSGTTRPA